MYEILLINDDGLYSPGLRALLPIFADDYNLTVVAPFTQKSWIGKASSYHRTLRYEHTKVDGVPAFLFDGTPSDCAVAGIYHFCKRKPDLLISGINAGANIGDSYILSSGTVGGALEGAIAGIPSIAVGVEFSPITTKKIEFEPTPEDLKRFQFAARFTGRLVRCLLKISLPPEIRVFNLNFDEGADENSPVEITRPARYNYGNFLEKKNKGLFHKGAVKDLSQVEPGTDMAAIRDGKISLSLIGLFTPIPPKFGKNLIKVLREEK